MEIRLLKDGYKRNDEIYTDFMKGRISPDAVCFSDEVVSLESAPFFPIYMAKGKQSERQEDFREAVRMIDAHYLNTPRDIHLNGRFWHSWALYQRDAIMEKYGAWLETEKQFRNIVFKKFDWENYIYKSVLLAEYIQESYPNSQAEKDYYANVVLDNIDLYNYILKYRLFRNSDFVIKFFTAVEQLEMGSLLKAQVKDRPDLGADERYGRLVILQMNHNYPVVMAPFLSVDELKGEIVSALLTYASNDVLEKYEFHRDDLIETYL